jgi:hypothetical protein
MNKLRKLQTGFTQIPNALWQDDRLSLKAKGVYGLLASKPDNWVYIEEVLVRESRDGRDSFRAAVAELIETGWLEKNQVQDIRTGKFSHTEWVLAVAWKAVDGSSVDGESAANNNQRTNTQEEIPPVSPQRTKATSNANRGQRLEAYLEQAVFSFDPCLPNDFSDFAEGLGWTGDEILAVFERFEDYWRAQPGQRGVKADWFATWRNWCRREADNGKRSSSARGAPGGGLASAVSAVVAARHGGVGAEGPLHGGGEAGGAAAKPERPRNPDGSPAIPY